MGAHVIAVTALLTFNGIFTRLVPVSVRVFVFWDLRTTPWFFTSPLRAIKRSN
jgi:hypothetical protein